MTQLIFVVDPMCSWSWGFYPVIDALRADYPDRYGYTLVVGGLRTIGDMTWDNQSIAYLRANWEAVAQTTAQPFNHALLSRPEFDYDTYPACRALIAVRELWGESAAFEYLGAIQKAFYVESRDITNPEVLASYIEHDVEAFLAFYHSERAQRLMKHDFAKARSMGANSFPSVVKVDKEGHMVCIKGYRTLEEVLWI